MEQTNTAWNNEQEINLRDLWFHILKKWRNLIVLFLIGALIGCGFSVLKMQQDDMEVLEKKLTKLEEDDVDEDKVQQYADYVQLYEDQVKHDKENLILKLDPENVWSGGASWFITADENIIDEVCTRYNNALRRGGTLQDLYAKSGLDCSETEFASLIGFGASKIGLDQQIVGEKQENKTRYAQVTISVWYSDEEICRNILSALMELAEKTNKEMAAMFPDTYKSSKQSDYITNGYSDGVRNAQVSAVGVRKGYLDNIAALKEELNQDELDYYKFYYDKKSMEKTDPTFSKLYPAAFAVGLLLVGMLCFAVAYIMSGKLKNEEELSRIFGLRVFGVCQAGKKYGRIDRWLRKREQRGSIRAVNGEYLNEYLRTLEYRNIGICLDTGDEFQKALADELARGNERVVVAGDLAADWDAPGIIAGCDGILLLTRVGRTGYTELRHTMELTKGINKKIIGAIAIR